MSKEHMEKFTQARLSNPGQCIQGIGANRDPLEAAFFIQGFPDSSVGKESFCTAADPSSIPGLGRSSGEGKVYPPQYSGLENSMDYIVYGSQRIGRDWATFTFFIPEGSLSINVNHLWCLRWQRICLWFRRPGFNPWVGKIPWRREWLTTPVFLLGEFHGQRSLAGVTVHGVTKGQAQLSD